MGVKGLCAFFKKKIPQVFHEIPLEMFKKEFIAIDASVFLYKYISNDNRLKGNWVDMFLELIHHLRNLEIRPIFVFDGKAPIEKTITKKKRSSQRKKIQDRINFIENIIEKLDEKKIL